MPRFILHLHHRVDDGVAMWAQRVDEKGRASIVDSLAECAAHDPELFAGVPEWVTRPMRHRAHLADGRVPRALQVSGARLAVVMDAVRGRVRQLGEQSQTRPVASEAEVDELIASLAAEGTRVKLSDAVFADPSVMSVLTMDVLAREVVAERQVVPVFAPAQFGSLVLWAPAPGAFEKAVKERTSRGTLGAESRALCEALIDSHARVAFEAARSERARSGALVGAEELPSLDSVGAQLVDALGPAHTGLSCDPHVRRRVTALVSRYIDSGLTGVLLQDREPRLVVRICEASDQDSPWYVEVCLKERTGTVHPLDSLVSAGDLSPSDALAYTVRIRSHAPTLSAVQPSGFTWALPTREVSAFLSNDALVLEGAGIEVLMPREWAKKPVAIHAQVEASTDDAAPSERKGTGVSHAIGNFRFRVAIGDVELTEDEAEALLQEQAELVKLRGEWVRVDAATLKAAETFLSACAQAEKATDDPALRAMIMANRMRAQTNGESRTTSGSQDNANAHLMDSRRVSAHDFQHVLRTPELSALTLTIEATSPDASDSAHGDSEHAAVTKGTGLEALFGAHIDLPELPPPTALRATLRPYQQRGLDWLTFLDTHHLGGILADDMGLGKTMQILALLVREREDPQHFGWGTHTGGPTLLVCPMSVLGSWQRETATFAPHLSVYVHHGPHRARGEALRKAAAAHDIVLTTYALIVRDFDDWDTIPFHRVILDEAQHVKNADTLVSKAVRSLPPGRRLALTGTPVENDLTDLHSIMRITNPGLLPESERDFTEQFATPISEGDEAAQAQLTRLIQPFVLRRVKTDRAIITDLPEKREERAFVNITPEQAGLYQALVDDMAEQLAAASTTPGTHDTGAGIGPSAMKKRAIVASTLMKMKQVLGHPAHFLADGSPILDNGEHRSGKMERIDDLLSTIVANNEKALIFTQFTNFAPAMIEHWESQFGIDVPFLHGGVSKADRDDMVRAFQHSPGQPGAMLLSLRAGGTGITLTAANHVIHLDRWWNPAVENQATDRAFRIGQQRNVEVHKLISLGTIEEAIDSVLASKNALAESTIRSGESWLADLSDATLASMFALRNPDGEEAS